ncbi:Protein of unknown function DUF819 [Dillenia turbinata]|uniref:Uncharacterized protein n=1 Tax=Dillenia turbinata TaxID=194707 RepID=A0AAN8Z464_9MAGN
MEDIDCHRLVRVFAICKIGSYLTNALKIQGGHIPCIMVIVVVLATAFPKHFNQLAPSGEATAFILMQVQMGACGRYIRVCSSPNYCASCGILRGDKLVASPASRENTASCACNSADCVVDVNGPERYCART